MRVLYVETPTGFGGSAKSLVTLLRALPTSIEPIIAAYYDLPACLTIPHWATFEQLPAPRPREGRSRFGRVVGYARHVVSAARDLRALCKRYRPDLIHANNCVLANLPAGLVGARMGIPVISHQRGYEFAGRVDRRIATRGPFECHVAISDSVRHNLIAQGVPESRVERVYNPIDPPAATLGPGRPRNAVPTIAMFAMLTPWKGHEVFIDAIALVRARFPSPFGVWIHGSPTPGNEAYASSLQRRSRALGLESIVHFAGFARDIEQAMRGTDIAVHASIDPEPFGRAIAEAMACGAATVAAAAGGATEIVEHGVNGLLTRPGDPESLADAILRLLRDPSERARFARAGESFVRDAFSVERSARAITAIYEAVLSKRPVRRERRRAESRVAPSRETHGR